MNGLVVLGEPRVDHVHGVGIRHLRLIRAALVVRAEHGLVSFPVRFGIFEELFDRVHGVDQRVLISRFITPGHCHAWEVASKDTAGPHLILNVSHVHRLIGLCVTLLVHRQELHHAVVASFLEQPRVVVQEVPLLHQTAGPRPGGEGGEAPRIHAGGIGRQHAPEVPVDHGAHFVGHGMQLIHARVADEAERFADVAHVLQFFATREMQGLRTASRQCINSVLQQAIGQAQEGHISNAETAALLDAHIVWVVAHLNGIELVRVFQASQGIHGLELIQQHPGWGRFRALMAEPARKAWTQKALPSRDDVNFGCSILHATSDVLDRKGPVAQNGATSILHAAVVPAEGATLSVAHSVTDLSPCCNEFVFTWILDDTVDLICTWEVIDHRGLHCGGDAAVLGAVGIVSALRQLHSMVRIQLAKTQLIVSIVRLGVAHDLQAGNLRGEGAVLSEVVLFQGIAHRIQDLLPHRMVVHTSACARASLRSSWAIEGFGVLGTTAVGGVGAIATVATEVELMTPPNVEGAEVCLAPGILGGRVEPGIASGILVTVEEHDVFVLVQHVLHRHLHPIEATTDDAHRMRPSIPRMLEILQAIDDHGAGHRGIRLQRGALRCQGGQLRTHAIAEHLVQCLKHVAHRGFRLSRQVQGFLLAFDLQVHSLVLALLLSGIAVGIVLAFQQQHVALKLVVEGIQGFTTNGQIAGKDLLVDELKIGPVESLDHLVGI
mmetsp:Transcript_57031/g.90440  ORF Transcript_57031/g.90440 Transcript_57031/m.90440 type:complete len:720 (-) Transcript_57031:585-2744(-)